MNITQVKNSLPVLFKSGITPLLVGHKGIGKSHIVKQVAKENDLGLIELRLGQADGVGDLIGLADFLTDSKGNKTATKFIVPHFLPKSGKYILFLDEINRASKDVLQAIFELVYDRTISINGFTLPEGSYIVAAMNPSTEDYQVSNFSDAAFADRFCHIKVEPTVSEWIDHAGKVNFSPDVVSFIQQQPSMLEKKLQDFTLDVTPSRRSWEMVSKVVTNCQDESILFEMIQGIVGTEATLCFINHKKTFDLPLSALDIAENYDKVRPRVLKYAASETNRTDILNQVNDNIITYMTEKESLSQVEEDNIVDYLIDLPKDLLVGFIRDSRIGKAQAYFSTNGEPGGVANSEKLTNHVKTMISKVSKQA